MALNTEYVQMFKPWFDGNPVAGVKGTGTLTISGVVSDTETVTIGSNTYEFDTNDTYTAGNIQVDISDLRNQATGTLTFTGIPVDTQTVTIGTDIYEFCVAAPQEGNIGVVLGGTFTADNAVTVLTSEINAHSTVVTAVGSTANDTVVLTAVSRGIAGNSIATTETCTNAGFAEVTLTGGLATITAPNAVTALVAAITANDAVVNAVDGDNDTVVVTAKYVGTDYNSVATTETMANGSFGHDHLQGGVYATPVNCPAFIIISGVWWIADAPVTKYTVGGWKSATPA